MINLNSKTWKDYSEEVRRLAEGNSSSSGGSYTNGIYNGNSSGGSSGGSYVTSPGYGSQLDTSRLTDPTYRPSM